MYIQKIYYYLQHPWQVRIILSWHAVAGCIRVRFPCETKNYLVFFYGTYSASWGQWVVTLVYYNIGGITGVNKKYFKFGFDTIMYGRLLVILWYPLKLWYRLTTERQRFHSFTLHILCADVIIVNLNIVRDL